jgi:hypothetical protein
MTTVKKVNTIKMVSYLMMMKKMLKAAKFSMKTTFPITMKRERMSSTRAKVKKSRYQPTRDPNTERRILLKYAITYSESYFIKGAGFKA